MRNGVNYIDKPDFLTAYLAARIEAMVTKTIRSGFAAIGLVPYDPERVLSKLNIQLQTPTPPPTITTIQQQWVPKTPHNPTDLELQAQAIREYIRRRTTTLPSPTDIVLQQLVKGCQMAIHSATILAEENRQLRAENER